jgi:hypothetical protein
MAGQWQQIKKLTVPAGGTATFTLTQNAALERLTVWALSGYRTLTNMNFQVKVNGADYNTVAPVTITSDIASDVIYRSGGAFAENDLIPYIPAGIKDEVDSFDFTVVCTNAGGVAETVTIIACGIHHQA